MIIRDMIPNKNPCTFCGSHGGPRNLPDFIFTPEGQLKIKGYCTACGEEFIRTYNLILTSTTKTIIDD